MRARKPSDNKRELVKHHLTLPFGLTPSGSRQEVTKEALRHQAWGAASQSCGSMSLPLDAAVQQQPQPVVSEVAEAVPNPFHLLDQQVHGLGGPVGAALGGMPGQDLGLPGPHGASQPGQFRELDAIAPAVEAVQGGAGCRWADRSIDGPEQFFALPGCGHLAGRIPGSKAGP
jgi:hypothetical protein